MVSWVLSSPPRAPKWLATVRTRMDPTVQGHHVGPAARATTKRSDVLGPDEAQGTGETPVRLAANWPAVAWGTCVFGPDARLVQMPPVRRSSAARRELNHR